MKVAFDARPASDLHGLGRYTRCVLSALQQTGSGGDEVVRTRRPQALARTRAADVFHAPWLEGAMLHSACPTVVTVHCLGALKRRSEHLRSGLRQRLRHLAVQRAAAVIVPSEAVAGDAIEHLGVEPERVSVIPHAADPAIGRREDAEVERVRRRYRLPERYLLWVGGLEHPDPAVRLAELAGARRELPLVLVGATSQWARELPRAILTGRVNDGELAAIYSGAHALVIPSEEDSFGLQALEALACGTPVVAFDTPARRQTLGGRAELVAPGDMGALIERAQAAARPAPAAVDWRWEDAAMAIWGVYARVAASEAAEPVRARPVRQARRAGPVDWLEPR